jgi:hypothetical protein
MEHLGKIFGSKARVKIMRLFLFNENNAFDVGDIISKSFVKRTEARSELNLLTKIGFIKKKKFTKKIPRKATKKNPQLFKTKKTEGWILSDNFCLKEALQKLLIESELVNEKELIKKIKKAGTIKFAVLSGLFLKDDDRKLDILVVGNRIKKNILQNEISKLEAEIGRELSYAVFEIDEFKYRLDMNDKLIRDVMENKNHILINKL